MQITMGKEYASSDKMVCWLSGDFFETCDKFLIDFTGAKALCNVSTKYISTLHILRLYDFIYK